MQVQYTPPHQTYEHVEPIKDFPVSYVQSDESPQLHPKIQP